MGEVYRARDEKLNRDVAIKVLPTSLSQDQDRLRRFEQEAQAAGALNHPNILTVYDVGTHDDAPYVVSELLEGETLRERLDGPPTPQRKAVDYATQIAIGLAAAHARSIVHRDLKPENIFIASDGQVKILAEQYFHDARWQGICVLGQAHAFRPLRGRGIEVSATRR